MNATNLQQNVDMFLSVAATVPVGVRERDVLVDFLSQKNLDSNKYAVYKGEQSYFFENDKLVNFGDGIPLKNIQMAYRFDGHSFTMQELPKTLVCLGGGSNKPKGGGSTNNNNNNNS